MRCAPDNLTQKKVRGLKAWQRGHKNESLTALFLQLKGYQIMARNWRCPLGEIDLIAYKNKTMIFIEVKSRKSYDEGAMALGSQQMARLQRAALVWMAGRDRMDKPMRFDVVIWTPWALPRHLKNVLLNNER